MKINSYILLLVTILGGLGCAHKFEMATIFNHTISNRSVGFNGYDIKIPDGYFIRKSAEEFAAKNETDLFFEDLNALHNRTKDLAGRLDFFQIVDAFVLYNPQTGSAITITVATMPHNREFNPQSANAGFSERTINNNKTLTRNRVIKFKGITHNISRATVLGKMDEFFNFISVRRDNDARKARETLELMLLNVTIY